MQKSSRRWDLCGAPGRIAQHYYSPASDNDGSREGAPESSSRLSRSLGDDRAATATANDSRIEQHRSPKMKSDNADKPATRDSRCFRQSHLDRHDASDQYCERHAATQ